MTIDVRKILKKRQSKITKEVHPVLETVSLEDIKVDAKTIVTRSDDQNSLVITGRRNKYANSSGEIVAIDNTLIEGTTAFECSSNEFLLSINKVIGITGGTTLSKDGVGSVTFKPVLQNTSGYLVPSKRSVYYSGGATSIQFDSIDNGVRTHIYLNAQQALSNNIKFNVETSGLSAELSENLKELNFKSSDGKSVFSATNIYQVDANGTKSTNVVINHSNGTLTIIPDSTYEGMTLPITVFIDFTMSENNSLSFKTSVNDTLIPNDDKLLTLGIKEGKEYSFDMYVNTNLIMYELLNNNFRDYKVNIKLTYEDRIREEDSEGILIYSGSMLVSRDNLTSTDRTIFVDITELVKEQYDAFSRGLAVSDIKLTFMHALYNKANSDGIIYDDGVAITNDYVEVIGLLNDERENRPSIELEINYEGEVEAGTPFKTYQTGKAGTTSINLYSGDVSHVVSLGIIKEKALSVGVDLVYDSRVLKEQKENDLVSSLGYGWMTNLSQRLVKGNNYSKLFGSKSVVYYDGERNPHILKERWFYDEDNIRHYVAKSEVYLDNDQKLKYRDSNGVDHEVEYEATNDEGLTLVSTNSRMNYVSKEKLKTKQKYFIKFLDGSRYELQKNNEGALLIPHFYKQNEEWAEMSEEDIPVWLCSYSGSSSSLKVKKYISYDEISYQSGVFSAKEQISIEWIPLQILYKNNGYYVRMLNSKFKYVPNSTIHYDFEYNGEDLNVEVETKYYFDRTKMEKDYFETEDIQEIENMILQIEDSILIQKNNIIEASQSYRKINRELSHNELLINLEKASLSSSSGSIYFVNRNSLVYESQLVQLGINISKSINKLNELEVALKNLNEQKEFLISQSKEGVLDYILDKEGNILGFDYYGKLIYISDKYENEIFVTYDENRIIEVSSSSQRMTFHYNDDKVLDYITDAQGRRKEVVITEDLLKSLSFIAENNEKQSIEFGYSEANLGLSEVEDVSGMVSTIEYENGKIKSFVQKVDKEKITSTSVSNLATLRVILDNGYIWDTNSCIISNNLTANIETYYFDRLGRLIKNMCEDVIFQKSKISVLEYAKKNIKFDTSYDSNDLIAISNMVQRATNYGETTFELTTSIKDKISASGFMFMRMSIENLPQEQKKDNELTLEITVFGGNDGTRVYTTKFNDFILNEIYCPFVVYKTNTYFNVKLITNNQITYSTLGDIQIYKAEGHMYYYDDKEHLILDKVGIEETEYLEYVNDNPTIIKNTDRNGLVRTSYQYFNDDNKLVFSEDHLGNCQELFYDDKGNVIESRSYNKKCPTLAKVTKVTYDEEGNATSINGVLRDDLGEYPQETRRFLPNTSKLSSLKSPSGQVTCYGYDFHTDEMLSLSSDNDGLCNKTTFKYRYGLLTSLSHHGFEINYEYDGKGRKTKVTIGGNTLFTYAYEDNVAFENNQFCNIVIETSNDGHIKRTIYDKRGKLLKVLLDDVIIKSCTYDEDERLTNVQNNGGTESVNITYYRDNLVGTHSHTFDGNTLGITNSYDGFDMVNRVTYNFGDKTTYDNVTYDIHKDHRVTGTSTSDGCVVAYNYDELSRVSAKVTSLRGKTFVKENVEYLTYDDNALDLVKEHTYQFDNKDPEITTYDYDVSGNIVKVDKDGVITRYKYDKLNRLIREDNGDLNKTITYKYDVGGNLLSKIEYPYTLEETLQNGTKTTFTYSGGYWKDQLTKAGNNSVTYDSMGRMTSIGDDMLTYDEQGRLIKYNDTIIEYDINGARKSKHDTIYYVSGNRILREKSSLIDITYLYSLDKLIGFVYNGITYFYQRNILGDIVKIYNTSSVLVAEYKYDAWGKHEVVNHTTLNIGDINPFRYRGYYYDKEIGLYYLNSRYYSSELCRFISPDRIEYLDPESINGLNLYAYCGNDPVNRFDQSGHAWEWSTFWQAAGYLATGIGAIVAGALVIASGIATLPMLLVAGITIGAGALTTINGVAEVGDLAFGYNFMEDGLFGGNSAAYNTYASITGTIATVGSIICGGWYRYNSPRIKAYKALDTYNVKRKHLPESGGTWSKFSSSDQVYLRSLGKTAIKNTPMSKLLDNSVDSYKLLYDFGFVIGTGGKMSIRLVFSYAGKIITFFPF